jgi:plasmid stabilization system protein ParE
LASEYQVIITPSAEEDLAEASAYIHARSPLNAQKWLRQLLRSIHDLESGAGFGRARESELLGVELRQKVFKSQRIVFSLDHVARKVTVHYVRHGARRAVGEEEGPDEG